MVRTLESAPPPPPGYTTPEPLTRPGTGRRRRKPNLDTMEGVGLDRPHMKPEGRHLDRLVAVNGGVFGWVTTGKLLGLMGAEERERNNSITTRKLGIGPCLYGWNPAGPLSLGLDVELLKPGRVPCLVCSCLRELSVQRHLYIQLFCIINGVANAFRGGDVFSQGGIKGGSPPMAKCEGLRYSSGILQKQRVYPPWNKIFGSKSGQKSLNAF